MAHFILLILFLNLTTITTILGADCTSNIVTAQIAAINYNEEFEKVMFELDKNLRLHYFTNDPNSTIPVYRVIKDIVGTLPQLKEDDTLVEHLTQQKDTLFGQAIATIVATDARDHFNNVTIQSLPIIHNPYVRPTPSAFDQLPHAIRKQVMTYALENIKNSIMSKGDSLPFYLCTKAVQNTHDEEDPSKIRTYLVYQELTTLEKKSIDDAIEQKNRK